MSDSICTPPAFVIIVHSVTGGLGYAVGRTTLPKTSWSGHGQDKHGHVQSLAGVRPWRRPKVCSKPIPIDFRELQKTFAQIDEETLEEEQESSVHVRLQYSKVVTEMPAHEAKVNGEEETFGKVCSGIQRNSKQSSDYTQNKENELPGYSQAQLLKEPEISSRKTTLRKTDGDASRTPPRAGSEERPVLEESNSNTNPDSTTENGSEEHQRSELILFTFYSMEACNIPLLRSLVSFRLSIMLFPYSDKCVTESFNLVLHSLLERFSPWRHLIQLNVSSL